jgi:hypothetical protein
MLTWRMFAFTCSESANPKISAAPSAPIGFQRPTIIAARPMNPRPALIPSSNRPTAPSVK